jgi:DNA-binding transcriptional ArsR family regulator
MAMSRSQPVHDPRVLRAIAHPVRSRILDEMSAAGPLRAADVAALLGIPANQASFHLRQLAKYGLIEEDPDAARDRRDRVWRPTAPDGLSINLAELAAAPGGAAAVEVWRRGSTAWAQRIVAEAYAVPSAPGRFRSISEYAVRLSEDEARRLSEEIDDVLRRWSDSARTRHTPDARTYLYFGTVGPYPETADGPAPREEDGAGAGTEG